MNSEKSALERLEQDFKDFWKEFGSPSVIAARHTEFVIEPKVFLGNKLNPEILKLLAVAYLAQAVKEGPGFGNIEVTNDKLTIKTPKGKPLIILHDKKIIHEYLAALVQG